MHINVRHKKKINLILKKQKQKNERIIKTDKNCYQILYQTNITFIQNSNQHLRMQIQIPKLI